MHCLQLVEADLRFEAGEQVAAESFSGGDIPSMDVDALSSIPAVHLTFDIIRRRVHVFSQLVEAWPECVAMLAGHQQPMVCIFNVICFAFLLLMSTFLSKILHDLVFGGQCTLVHSV